MKKIATFLLICLILGSVPSSFADPCGMVPPIWTGNQSPITRIGLQKTYVFHRDGVETFVIRPGFRGNVDNFGMLIPFPTPPEIRKVPDNIFEHIANAVDPPEVVVDLRIQRLMRGRALATKSVADSAEAPLAFMAKDKVRVLKEEAVGMYEVAVLEAGSSFALKKWLDENRYQYPEGMDAVTEDYVKQRWCFVAVKTRVGQQKGIQPRPGQRKTNPELPQNSVFDGNVQGMGFRFQSPELVVPMRLSAFNEGELRNIVYLLTQGPRKIRSIPEEYVVRQLSGQQIYNNVTQLLPLRIIGGSETDIPPRRRQSLPEERDPEPKNGIARDLFASDLLAVSTGELTLRHEEEEKELLRIGEHFGLRGGEVDVENADALAESRHKTTDKGLQMIKDMTLTVVDGDFPRNVIANQNLTFAEYNMPQNRNNTLNYDANLFGPGVKKEGVIKTSAISWEKVEQRIASQHLWNRIGLNVLVGIGLLGMIGTIAWRKPKLLILFAIATVLMAGTAWAEPLTNSFDDIAQWIDDLQNSKTAKPAIENIVKFSKTSESDRERAIDNLISTAKTDENLPKRGWAIAALAQIGGTDVDEYLLDIHANSDQPKIVRTWAAAARVSMTKSVNGLIEKANLVSQFPALGRPIGIRLIEKLSGDSKVDVEKVLEVTQKVPQLQQSLAPAILAFGAPKLVDVIYTAKNQNVRRSATSYLGALAQQGSQKEVIQAVTEHLEFDKTSMGVPWEGGPLFVPGIQWDKEAARELVGNLIRWYVWCDVNGKSQELRQIHNNIRSLGLARAAGYNSPGWNDVDTNAWLKVWGETMGLAEVETILVEQGLLGKPEYKQVIDALK
ncbi:MAG: DUF2330 domain-containing protein [Planctomycetota bacterium]